MQTDQTITRRGVSFQSAFRFRGAFLTAFAACVWGAAASAFGAPLRVAAGQDPTQESSFAIDFGGFGGVSNALIARTNFELEIDTAAGTARFNRYDQDIDPLMLPGGISTGNIRVEVVPNSSTGTFNPGTGEFVTSEVYAIHFDGDLSAYGLTSPVLLPSTSAGVANAASSWVGFVTMNWAGASQLNNPFDPSSLIDFSYVCSLFMSFSINDSTFIGLEMIPKVMSYGLAPNIESALVDVLNLALTDLAADNKDRAVRDLYVFMLKVARLRGTELTDAQAESLIADAKLAIRLIRGGLSTLPD